MTTIINDGTNTTYQCECVPALTLDNSYVEEYPIASREHWEAEIRQHCTCPEPEWEYVCQISGKHYVGTWTAEEKKKIVAVMAERENMTSQFRSHTTAVALLYANTGWEFFNKPDYTPPANQDELEIWFNL